VTALPRGEIGELPRLGSAAQARRARWFRSWIAPVTAATAVVALAISLVIVRDIPNARVVSPAGPVNATAPAAAGGSGPAAVVGYVRDFYRSYVAARNLGQRAAAAVVRSHVAAWYFPVLEAPATTGVDPVECGLPGPVADWSFKQAGVLGGQAVTVIGSQPPSGVSLPDAVAWLTQGGPEAGDPYLEQVRHAIARQHLGHDPVTCAASGVPDVSAGTTTLVAGSTVGVVQASAHRTQWLVTAVLGAKGWAVGDIACSA
jgi:hypothetical protein